MIDKVSPSRGEWDVALKRILPPTKCEIEPVRQLEVGGQDFDGFEQTALELYYGFLKQAKKTAFDDIPTIDKKTMRRSSILHGFLAMARIAGLSTLAYDKYHVPEEKTPQLDTILRQPSSFDKTAFFLANMENERNKSYEQHLGITGNTYKNAKNEEFPSGPKLTIVSKNATPHLEIDPYVHKCVEDEIAIVGLLSNGVGVKNCAALQGPLYKAWNLTIDECEARGLLSPATIEAG